LSGPTVQSTPSMINPLVPRGLNKRLLCDLGATQDTRYTASRIKKMTAETIQVGPVCKDMIKRVRGQESSGTAEPLP